MRHLTINAAVPGRSAAEVYAILCDFERYPDNSKEVRSITINISPGGQMTSTWELDFRGGILRWVEEDFFDADNHIINFIQIEGDIDHFSGEWKAVDNDEGCLLLFSARFDMGLPSLMHILDPIAELALRENITSIIKGMLGPNVVFLSHDPHAETPHTPAPDDGMALI